MEYAHKGVKITFSESSGTFMAVVGDKNVRAPSLAAIKARIDKAQETVFEPFAAFNITSRGYGAVERQKIERFQVIGVSVSKRRSRASYSFQLDGRNAYYSPTEVIVDTPGNRELAAAIIEHEYETAKIVDERGKVAEDMRKRLVRRSAEEPTK